MYIVIVLLKGEPKKYDVPDDKGAAVGRMTTSSSDVVPAPAIR